MNWGIHDRRGWMAVVLLLCAYPFSAQNTGQITLELRNKPLPAVLKLIEKAGEKHIIFSYNETETYHVTASIHQRNESEALSIVLKSTPFIYKERENYFVIQKGSIDKRLITIRGSVIDENNEPLVCANVLLLDKADSAFVNGVVTNQDGSFRIPGEEGRDYLLKTSYIGYQTKIQPCGAMNKVCLFSDTQLMKEVVISVDHPLIVHKDNGLLANVVGTPLAKMGSAAEMISHLPFVTGGVGEYMVLGHGVPVIYINGRKIRDQGELERLRADDILSAEVITTPGVEYGSDVSSVIRIRTIRRRGQGISSGFLGNNFVYKDGEKIEEISSLQHAHTYPTWTHSVNGYYNGVFGQWNVDFNADYLLGKNNSTNEVFNNDDKAAQSENEVRNYLYAMRMVVKRSFRKGTLSFGTEETFTNRHDIFVQSGFSDNADDHIKQSIYSVFADYSLHLDKFNVAVGLRYEHQKTDYYEYGVHQDEQSPVYNDIVPVALVGYEDKGWHASLSYRLIRNNPDYHMLSSSITYSSKYMYRSGDPLLVPQKHHVFILDAGSRWAFVNLFFDRTLDLYTRFLKPYNDETHPGVLLFTMASIPTTDTYGMNLNVSPKIGCWQPQLNGGMYFYDADVRSLGITRHWNEPQFYFELDNSFTFPDGWFLNVNGNISTAAKQSYSLIHREGTVNARLSKSFLEDALMITLTADDIFHTRYHYMDGYGVRSHILTRSYNDNQRLGIQISYKFNATKSKYKGTGAGQSEKQRL
ncbi:outer membrane beta-barrel protein [Bacteroides fragilis]|uniref:outer membrane beta-barrel family protein n=1 Tax=Bacteroides fragilis TaxID=817 RepID=UPI0022218373|nr:outer membrane beta-barrel family protein [Bacteroides fragilis]MCB5172069.1 outer membrane beta-barrel protein [Bacteroides fragilis]MCS3247382.1 outer membrane beta-barrel protein [Bacteroides fragilis]UYV04534.1 outer membrane beta-barrel protein [Bacteroides fragilis]